MSTTSSTCGSGDANPREYASSSHVIGSESRTVPSLCSAHYRVTQVLSHVNDAHACQQRSERDTQRFECVFRVFWLRACA
eukprot:6437536-Pyramimonas_sp.AAC.1